MHLTSWIELFTFAAAVVIAARKSRVYGIFAAIILGFPTLLAVSLGDFLGLGAWVLLYLHGSATVHFLALAVRPRMRPEWFRLGISLPGLYFVGVSLLALPWAVTAAIGVAPVGWWVPFALAGLGLLQSLRGREEDVTVVLDGRDAGPLQRFVSPGGSEARALKLIQITDPHLGPFMPVARLRRICTRAVERDPDLVLITGDLMTMESHDAALVTEALEPLAALRGRVFACHGNHDHEARAVVAEACERLGITLLIDREAVIETPAGVVQIVGADFTWRGRDEHLRQLAEVYPRRDGALRLWLLHDPGAFVHIPEGEADLVLSGHTHGGQVGFLSLGGRQTIVSALTKVPDHGLWGRGRDRLYVHRAQGHYGYPIRLGVPSEESMLHVHRV